MTNLTRQYLFSVKPHRLETLDSYTARLLAANFEEDRHQRYLTKLHQSQHPDVAVEESLAKLIAAKSGRDTTRLQTANAAPVQHQDGTTCQECERRLATRVACTLCTRGERVAQHPHFLSNVCLTHHRWIGPGTPASQQTTVNAEVLGAERRFQKLRRQGRIDPPLYFALRDILTRTIKNKATGGNFTNIDLYPQVVSVAGLLTQKGFQHRLFDPARSFKAAHAVLTEAVHDQLGEHPDLTRALWLYLRPTFLSVRKSLEGDGHYRPTVSHEFTPPQEVLEQFTTPVGPSESFDRHLRASGDFELTRQNAFHVLVPIQFEVERLDAYGQVQALCRLGHRMDRKMGRLEKQTNLGEEKCAICSNTTILSGFNDMATTHPLLAAEFSSKNLPLTAAQVFAGSSKSYWWVCTAGHEFKATGSNRSAAKTGCPVCQHRLIITGVNDAATSFPHLAREFHPTKNSNHRLETLAPGANKILWWKCEEGHTFRTTLGNRTRGKGCHFCERRPIQQRSISNARPDLAAEWHPDNLPLTPDDVTIGSNRLVKWLCPKGHVYVQKPERRNAKYGCFICSSRKHIRGVNDAETQFPEICSEWHSYKNCFKEPSDIVPGTALYWWRCKDKQHVTEQSIPHRVKSGGCTECIPSRRIMNQTA